MRKVWRDLMIVKYRRSGHPYAAIGSFYNLSPQGVRHIVQRDAPELITGEWCGTPFSPSEKAKVRSLIVDKRRSYSQVANRLGRTRNSIAGYCFRNGIKKS